jgi:hypothetical protein
MNYFSIASRLKGMSVKQEITQTCFFYGIRQGTKLTMLVISFLTMLLLSASPCFSKTITVTPADSYTKIESAQAGDIVEIAPGTYKFRLNLTQQGTADNPIIIRAQDRQNRPVWDLSGKNVNEWPGSYSGGDADRGAWQLRYASYYVISDIVIRNATNGKNSSGIILLGAKNNVIRNCLMQLNDNGIIGDGENNLIEFTELDRNGRPGAAKMTHNLYLYGGSMTIRNSYIHDATHGQNFHVRNRECVIENSWIARANNYEGDIMTGPDPVHTLTLRGNVIIAGSSPDNSSRILDLYNSPQGTGVRMHFNLFYNTIIGNGNSSTALVVFENDSMEFSSATVSNNIVFGITKALGTKGGTNWSLTGTNNWFPQGSDTAGLQNSFFGTNPGFRNPGAHDYTLTANAAPVNKADVTAAVMPAWEYYKDETTVLRYRQRTKALDLGAFESTTSSPDYGVYEGPYFDNQSPLPPKNLRIINN